MGMIQPRRIYIIIHNNTYSDYIPGTILAWPTIIVSLIPEFKELSPVFVRYTFFLLSDDSMIVLFLHGSRTVAQLIIHLSTMIINYSFQNNIKSQL